MRFLITNDDGIDSVGIEALKKAALRHGHEAYICAPSHQCSAFSQHITLNAPILVQDRDDMGVPAMAVDGSPCDCVRLGLEVWPRPDLVLSGINNGYNSGSAVYYSGTCSAAREAAMLNLNAMAVSIDVDADEGMRDALAEIAVKTAERMAGKTLPRFAFISLNAPATDPAAWKPMKMCALSDAYFRDRYEMRVAPKGQKYFWLKSGLFKDPETPGSDCDLLEQGYVTCTVVGALSEQNNDYEFLL